MKFFNAQMNEPCRNDWVLTVQSDLELLELDYNFEEIKCLKKRKWLKIVKEACKEKAFDNILDEKDELSKGSEIQYGEFKMRNYFKSKLINVKQAKLIFKIRTRMLRVKNNFKNGNENLSCPLCKGDEDSQEHMLTKCMKLQNKITHTDYRSLFGCDVDKMAEVVKKVEAIVEEREAILENMS